MSDSEFSNDFINTFDKASVKYENFLIMGDINYDMLVAEKSKTMREICDVCDLSNIVKGPTCFTKTTLPSLNDLILTNRANFCMNTLNFNCGLSDVHNIISVQIKGSLPSKNKEFRKYKSLKFLNKKLLLKT